LYTKYTYHDLKNYISAKCKKFVNTQRFSTKYLKRKQKKNNICYGKKINKKTSGSPNISKTRERERGK